MKENSIEEALKKLSTGKKIKMYELLRTFKKEGIENFVITRKKYVDVILSDYKRVLKANEKLKDKLLDTLEGQKVIKEETPQYIKENYIPVEKVKDKIEELNNVSNAEELEDIMDGKNYTITELVQYVLQELLESEE